MISRVVGLDLDNCLAHTGIHLLEALQKEGKIIGRTFDEVIDYRMEKSFSKEITYQDILNIFKCPEFWYNIPENEFLATAIYRLIGNDIKVHIVTARTPDHFPANIEEITKEWLWNNNIKYK